MQKVQIFESDNIWDLKNEVNEFVKTHHVEQISYAVSSHEYRDCYSCCILYTKKEN